MVDKQELLQGGDALHNVDSNDPGEEDADEENQEVVDEEEKMYKDIFNLVSHTNPSITQEGMVTPACVTRPRLPEIVVFLSPPSSRK